MQGQNGNGVGLLAAEPVRWLLSEESHVHGRVAAFLRGEDGPEFDVAGPPDDAALLQMKKSGPNGPVPLPCVRLKCSKFTHHLTGEDGVAVTCSDRDLLEIMDWRRRESIRRALLRKGN